jgi:hypothetical protein
MRRLFEMSKLNGRHYLTINLPAALYQPRNHFDQLFFFGNPFVKSTQKEKPPLLMRWWMSREQVLKMKLNEDPDL